MTVVLIFDQGNAFSPAVLDIEEKTLIDQFLSGIKTVAALSLALNFPTQASVTHSLVNSYKNLLAVALETEFSFDLGALTFFPSEWSDALCSGTADALKDRLANPDAYAVRPHPDFFQIVVVLRSHSLPLPLRPTLLLPPKPPRRKPRRKRRRRCARSLRSGVFDA